MSHRAFSFLLLAVLLAAAVGVPGAAAPLRFGLMPAMNSAPLVVAARAGFFAAEGVEVDLQLFTSQLNRETALQAGHVDGTVSDLINAIQAWSRGFGVKVTSASEGIFTLLSAPGSPLRTLGDWKGASRAVATGLLENSTVCYAAERCLERVGIPASTIDLVPVLQVPARMEMLLAGKLEAAVLPEPLATVAAAGGAHRLADTSAEDPASGVIVFTSRALAARGSDIAAFYRGYDRGVAELNAHPDRWRKPVVEACQFPAAVESTMPFPAYQPAHLPSAEAVADVASWMVQKGLVGTAPRWSDIVAPGLYPGDAARH